jgi:hypothetical protein
MEGEWWARNNGEEIMGRRVGMDLTIEKTQTGIMGWDQS